MMINQGINEVIADGFTRDRGQKSSELQNSGTDFDNIRHYQNTTVRLQLVYQQVGPD